MDLTKAILKIDWRIQYASQLKMDMPFLTKTERIQRARIIQDKLKDRWLTIDARDCAKNPAKYL